MPLIPEQNGNRQRSVPELSGVERRGSGNTLRHGEGSLELAVALVVEDEWLVRMEIAEALETHGWTVLEAGTGEAALLARDHDPAIELVVTDIRLPGPVTGWDVADAFRAANPQTAVIYCSGNACEPKRQVPGSVFLTKPCRMDRLVEASVKLSPQAVLDKRAD
jgi:two-component system, response regulator PdtaR